MNDEGLNGDTLAGDGIYSTPNQRPSVRAP